MTTRTTPQTPPPPRHPGLTRTRFPRIVKPPARRRRQSRMLPFYSTYSTHEWRRARRRSTTRDMRSSTSAGIKVQLTMSRPLRRSTSSSPHLWRSLAQRMSCPIPGNMAMIRGPRPRVQAGSLDSMATASTQMRNFASGVRPSILVLRRWRRPTVPCPFAPSSLLTMNGRIARGEDF